MQEDITPLNQQLSNDPRWGQLGVMVQTVLKEEYDVDVDIAKQDFQSVKKQKTTMV